MSTPRDPKEVKKQVLAIIKFYEDGFKDKFPNDPYFDGYRAALKEMHSLIEENVKTEI
jgi:hypothetical protein